MIIIISIIITLYCMYVNKDEIKLRLIEFVHEMIVYRPIQDFRVALSQGLSNKNKSILRYSKLPIIRFALAWHGFGNKVLEIGEKKSIIGIGIDNILELTYPYILRSHIIDWRKIILLNCGVAFQSFIYYRSFTQRVVLPLKLWQ